MKIKTEKLLGGLTCRTRINCNEARDFKEISLEDLRWKPEAQTWNVLECLEHLNLYGAYYLPEIERAINTSKFPPEEIFKSGVVGNYFARMMLPREKINKMKTFKDKDPLGCNLDKTVIDHFIDDQLKMIELLHKAAEVSLGKTKTGISISSFIKLKLGDTLRVVIYHNQRHIAQAYRVLEEKSQEEKLQL